MLGQKIIFDEKQIWPECIPSIRFGDAFGQQKIRWALTLPMELFTSKRWRLYRPKQKAVVFMLNPKNYVTPVWQHSIVVWLLGQSSCSSPSNKELHALPFCHSSEWAKKCLLILPWANFCRTCPRANVPLAFRLLLVISPDGIRTRVHLARITARAAEPFGRLSRLVTAAAFRSRRIWTGWSWNGSF